MKKNIFLILLILIVPLCAYWWLTQDKLTVQPANASTGDEIIKFASPMCYECQELEQVFNLVYPKYKNKVNLNRVDVTNKDKQTQAMISEYQIRLVPTTIFKNQDRKIIRQIQGTMEPKVLESYFEELINE